MTVKAILASKGTAVITIEPTARLRDAAKLLSEHRIGAALVLGADNRIVGIVSERDIVRALADLGGTALDEHVGLVMTRKVATCNQAETVRSIMERMTAGRFRHVPVVESSRLIGIVSIGDVVKHRLGQLEQESTALHEYIQTA
jgi:CBS domain-containing protein